MTAAPKTPMSAGLPSTAEKVAYIGSSVCLFADLLVWSIGGHFSSILYAAGCGLFGYALGVERARAALSADRAEPEGGRS